MIPVCLQVTPDLTHVFLMLTDGQRVIPSLVWPWLLFKDVSSHALDLKEGLSIHSLVHVIIANPWRRKEESY